MKGLSLRIIEEIEKTIGTQFDEFALRFLGIIPKLSRSKKIVFFIFMLQGSEKFSVFLSILLPL